MNVLPKDLVLDNLLIRSNQDLYTMSNAVTPDQLNNVPSKDPCQIEEFQQFIDCFPKKKINMIAALCIEGGLCIEKGLHIGFTKSEVAGNIRFNPDTNEFEGYNGTEWVRFGCCNNIQNNNIQNINTINSNSDNITMNDLDNILGYNENGADYAELFESNLNEKIPVGTTVVIDNETGFIRPSTSDDEPSSILGVVTGTAGIVANLYNKEWCGKYLKNEYGEYVIENVEVETEEPMMAEVEKKVEREVVIKNGEQYSTAIRSFTVKDKLPVIEEMKIGDEVKIVQKMQKVKKTEKRLKVSPDFDENQEYIPRLNRPEWNVIGLLGQLHIKKGQVTGNTWKKIKDVNDNVELWLVK